MFGFLAAPALKLIAGRALANAKSDIAAIPPKVKLALLAIALLVAGYFLHQHVAHQRLKAQYDAGYAQGVMDNERSHITAQAQADARANQINSIIRRKSDEEARNIVRRADDLRMRGPGKATCAGVAAAPGSASGHDAASGSADAAVGGVPDEPRPVLIALPFAPTIEFAKQCDLNRNEALKWRESDAKLRSDSVSLESQVVSGKESDGGD